MQWHLLPSTNKSYNHRFSVHFTSWWVFAFDNKKLNMLKINKRGKRNQQHFVLLVSERQKGLGEREGWKIKSTVCGRERRTMCRMWALAGPALCLLLRLALCLLHVQSCWKDGERQKTQQTQDLFNCSQDKLSTGWFWAKMPTIYIFRYLSIWSVDCLANRQEYFYAFVSMTDVICDSYQMWIVMGVQFEVLW